MKIVTGIDLLEIGRIQQAIDRHGERFLNRIYTPAELEEVGNDSASLAARFAAKEAVAKALRTGIGAIRWHEIEIIRGEAREPILRLHGEAKRLAADQKLFDWSISLSHSQCHAVAMVVALRE